MSNRKVIWEGSKKLKYRLGSTYLTAKSLLFIVDGVIREEHTFLDGNTGIFSLSSFLDDWKRGRYFGPPLPEEVKLEMALRELKR